MLAWIRVQLWLQLPCECDRGDRSCGSYRGVELVYCNAKSVLNWTTPSLSCQAAHAAADYIASFMSAFVTTALSC